MSISRFGKNMIAVTVICLAGLIFAACSGEEPAKTESVIILGNHMNSQDIDINNNNLIDETLDNVCRTGGKISVIVADGTPYLAASYEIEAPESGVSDNVVEKHVTSNKTALKEAIVSSNPYAKTEETDPVEALKLAGRIFDSSENSSDKDLLFAHTGVATTGLLKDNLTANPDDIVEYLKDSDVSLTFENVSATLTHLGEVADEQEELTDSQLLNIENIYSSIIENNGGKVDVDKSVESQSENEEKDLPHVSPVDFPEQEVANLVKGENAVLDDSALTFYANNATLIDENQAREVISPYAEQITGSKLSIVVLGLTAKVGDRNSSLELSEKRAETVKALLVDAGVDASVITAIGGGFDTSFYIDDTDEDGNLILSEATKNRRVILLNADTDTAKQIVAKHG